MISAGRACPAPDAEAGHEIGIRSADRGVDKWAVVAFKSTERFVFVEERPVK